ncbi:unnamed protein product, partial [Discosporangium mesarthrocarpum]
MDNDEVGEGSSAFRGEQEAGTCENHEPVRNSGIDSPLNTLVDRWPASLASSRVKQSGGDVCKNVDADELLFRNSRFATIPSLLELFDLEPIAQGTQTTGKRLTGYGPSPLGVLDEQRHVFQQMRLLVICEWKSRTSQQRGQGVYNRRAVPPRKRQQGTGVGSIYPSQPPPDHQGMPPARQAVPAASVTAPAPSPSDILTVSSIRMMVS